MKKRVFSLLLAFVLVIGLLPAAAQAYHIGELDGLEYEVYDDHVEIMAYYGDAETVAIPAKIEGLPVTVIQDYAFIDYYDLVSVSIPASVTSIGEAAFGWCHNLTSISVDSKNPNYCNDSRGVLFNKQKTQLIQAPGAIAGSYTIPSTVTTIGYAAFAYCFNLTSISIPAGVTEIGEGAFASCFGLTRIDIPKNVSSIGYAAFEGCENLTGIYVDSKNPNYSSDNRGVLFNKEKDMLIMAPGAIAGSYTIPSGVYTIGDGAFNSCYNLTGVSIPEGVTEIGYGAFAHCYNLTSITIPKSVDCIYDGAFYCCSSLTGIHVNAGNPYYSSDDRGVLFDKEKELLIQAPGAITGAYTIPDDVTTIGYEAFDSCPGLTDVSVPDSVTMIDSFAFWGSGLTSINIPASVTYMGNGIFNFCENLTAVRFEGSAPEFDDAIFYVDPDDSDAVATTVYYPANDPSWTEAVRKNCGEGVTWIGYNPEGSFYDVQMGSWYEAAVEWAVSKGITNGATADTFNPNGQCLRAQVVTFLYRAKGNPSIGSASNPFTDVKSSDFFYNPVLWAVKQGITNGTSATTFGSYDVCNRAAVVTFLWRAAGKPEPKSTVNPFSDVKPTDFFYKPVLWAIENNITNGIDATHFGPTSPCNRAQVVTFLYRAYN